jgi:ABC-type sugar transport system ATPase subunit
MVFQTYALYPHMTVSENLGFGLRMRGVQKSTTHQKILETAQLLGIEHLLDRKPRQLSGGQRQRVAMGRALVRRPKLFLLDEPLSNLDAQLRINVRLELKRLHAQIQTTIIYVTHDQVEAMTLGDKVVVMREGRIRQTDRPDTIYDRPSDTFVATFIGSPVMNLFKGRLVWQEGGFKFHNTGFSLDLGHLQAPSGENVVEVGIRPEDIVVGQGAGTVIRAEVEMISNVGTDKYIHAQLGGASITVRAPKEATFQPGQIVSLVIDPKRLHIFYEGRRL